MAECPYLNYFQAFEVIKANHSKGIEILQKTRDYFMEFSDKINSVHISIEEIQKGFHGIEDKSLSQQNSSSYWPKLKEPLNLSTLFKFMAEDIKLIIDKKLTNFITEYTRDYDELLMKIEINIKNQKEAEKEAKDAHDKYMKLGEEVQAAYDNNETEKLPKLRDDFVRAQNIAVDLHAKLNGKTLLLCTLFEQSLSTYEKLERKRIETTKAVYEEFVNRIGIISDLYNAKAELISAFTKDFDPNCDSEKLKSLIDLKDSECNPTLQPIVVSPQITKYLDLEHVFKEEISKGGKIAIVENDFKGEVNQLTVRKGEHVVAIKEDGDQYLCKNINDLIGLIPKSVIQFI